MSPSQSISYSPVVKDLTSILEPMTFSSGRFEEQQQPQRSGSVTRLWSSRPFKSQGNRPPIAKPPINQFIPSLLGNINTVRLIATNEETDADIMLGIMSLLEAQEEADRRELDLVLINDKGDPPVCKIIDYGKYKYAVEKRKKENTKKQAKSDVKEVKMSYKIDQHDFDVRLRAVQKFINDGDRVKVVVQFKGREMQHKELGRELLQRIYKPVEEVTVMEAPPKEEGRAIAMLLGPKPTK